MLPYLFVLLSIAVRFLPFAGPLNFMPHAWHFTPLAASLLFFGARGSRRQIWVPLVPLAAADVVLTKYIYGLTFSWDQLVTWAWYAAILWLGTNLREKTTFWRVVGAAGASSACRPVSAAAAALVPVRNPRRDTPLRASPLESFMTLDPRKCEELGRARF